MVKIALFLLAGVYALGQAASQTGRIDGRVENAAGDRVSKATVTLTRASGVPGPGGLLQSPQSKAVETRSDGTFSFEDLVAGHYMLRVERSGYAPLGRIRTFSLEAGQALADFTLKVTPQALITGRITDSDGDPLENAGVSVLRESYNRHGKQSVGIGSARTDSQGKYRISALPPGRYFLEAGARNYGVETFYPGSFDIAGASPITADAGSEHSGMDIRILRDGPARFAIRGKAVMSTGGNVAHNQTLTIKTRDGQGGGGPDGVVRDDGSFEIKDVKPGTYFIQTLDANARSAGVTTRWTDKGQVEVTVTDRDVDNVMLPVRPAMTITGKIKVDGGGSRAARPTVMLVAHDVGFNGLDPSAEAREDGSFEIGNAGPILYDIELRGLPPGLFVKTHPQVDLTGGIVSPIEIQVSQHASSVAGTVQPDAVVALWNVALWSADGVRTAIAGPHGAFRFDNLAPGDYRILAWEGVDNGLPEYAPFRALFESQATRLTLTEDAQMAPQVKTISGEASQAELRRIP